MQIACLTTDFMIRFFMHGTIYMYVSKLMVLNLFFYVAYFRDLIPMSSCLKDTFARCGEWSVIADVIIKGFAEFTELSYCKLNVRGLSAYVSFQCSRFVSV